MFLRLQAETTGRGGISAMFSLRVGNLDIFGST